MTGLSVVNSASKSCSLSPCGWSSRGCKVIRSTTLTTRDAELRQVFAQQAHRGERLQGRDVAGAGHHHIGLVVLVVAGPFPDADAGGAVLQRLVHAEPL